MPILKVKDNGEWKEIGEGSLVDNTLTVAGASADAKVTGDRINELGEAVGISNNAIESLVASLMNKANASDLDSHTSNKSNPHGVTAAQVGAVSANGQSNELYSSIATGWLARINTNDGTNTTTVGADETGGIYAYKNGNLVWRIPPNANITRWTCPVKLNEFSGICELYDYGSGLLTLCFSQNNQAVTHTYLVSTSWGHATLTQLGSNGFSTYFDQDIQVVQGSSATRFIVEVKNKYDDDGDGMLNVVCTYVPLGANSVDSPVNPYTVYTAASSNAAKCSLTSKNDGIVASKFYGELKGNADYAFTAGTSEAAYYLRNSSAGDLTWSGDHLLSSTNRPNAKLHFGVDSLMRYDAPESKYYNILDEENYKTYVTPANIGAISTSASCNRNWQWAAQSGTPAYVWGTNVNNGADCYVWYTGNFDVNSAAKIRSRGSVTAESGTNYPEVGGLSMSQVYTNGYPTDYGNVMTMYGVGCSQLLIGWSATSGANAPVYVRSKRDTADANWSSWAQVYDSAHKPTAADIGAMPATGGLFDNWAYRIEKSVVSGRFISARDRAIIRTTAGSDMSYCCSVSTKTPNGTWDMGTYGDTFLLNYASDANFNSGTNTVVQGLRITPNGALAVGEGSYGSTLPSGGVKGQIFFKI